MPTCLLGQNPAKLPSFYPIAEHTYGIKEGLPDMYMTHVLVDTTDRLHILKNGHGRTAFSLPFYGYDGTRAYPSSFEVEHKTNNLRVDIDPITNQYYPQVQDTEKP